MLDGSSGDEGLAPESSKLTENWSHNMYQWNVWPNFRSNFYYYY